VSTKAKILAIVSLPAGLVGYLVAGTVITNAGLQGAVGGLLFVFVPLFIAGLCMIPFIAPLLDEMAKRDLAAAPPRDEPEDGSPPKSRR
jgi:hypothetical protein